MSIKLRSSKTSSRHQVVLSESREELLNFLWMNPQIEQFAFTCAREGTTQATTGFELSYRDPNYEKDTPDDQLA